MTQDELTAVHQAVQMLVSAYSDVAQTLESFSDEQDPEIESEDCQVGEWISTKDRVPETDSELVVVRTTGGQIMFGSTIGGRFFRNIEYWYPLPKKI